MATTMKRKPRTSGPKSKVTKRTVKPAPRKRGKVAASKKPAARKRGQTTDSAKVGKKIVSLRDRQGKAWADVIDAVGLSGSQVRRLYRANGGKGKRS